MAALARRAAVGARARRRSAPSSPTQRGLPPATVALLRECARRDVDPMDALRMAAGTISLTSTMPRRRSSRACPTIVAAFWRLRAGAEPIAPRRIWATPRTSSTCCRGDAPDAERVRGARDLPQHRHRSRAERVDVHRARHHVDGLGLVSAVVGAIGALKGPLHGGAPGPALDMVFEIGEASRAEAVLRAKIERGEKLMGFGHRVYKVRDPRADVLAAAAERLFTRAGDMALYRWRARSKRRRSGCSRSTSPGGGCRRTSSSTPRCCCTASASTRRSSRPTFAISRVSGWIAHAIEQRAPTASSVRSRNTRPARAHNGCRYPSGPLARPNRSSSADKPASDFR